MDARRAQLTRTNSRTSVARLSSHPRGAGARAVREVRHRRRVQHAAHAGRVHGAVEGASACGTWRRRRIGFVVGAVNGFLLNRRWTFREHVGDALTPVRWGIVQSCGLARQRGAAVRVRARRAAGQAGRAGVRDGGGHGHAPSSSTARGRSACTGRWRWPTARSDGAAGEGNANAAHAPEGRPLKDL